MTFTFRNSNNASQNQDQPVINNQNIIFFLYMGNALGTEK